MDIVYSYTEPREGLKNALHIIGTQNKNVVVLSGDLANSTKTEDFKIKYPGRFVECGVAEQNLIAVATGLARERFVPVVADFAAFVPPRCLDQIRQQLGYGQSNVKIISSHAGLNVGGDGAIHQMLEDIAIMRAIPNIKVIAPATAKEAEEVVLWAVENAGPIYIRYARCALADISLPKFEIGRAYILQEGKDITLINTGALLEECLRAADLAKTQGIAVEVIHSPSIKPLDEETILKSAKKTGQVVTAEEAQVTGGFGSAVAELLSAKHPVKAARIGVANRFGHSGLKDELWKAYNIDREAIFKAIASLC